MHVVLSMTLFFSAIAGPVQPPKPRMHIAALSAGHVVWHGHDLRRPYVITVEYIASGDTTWGQILINDLPLHPRPTQPPVSRLDQLAFERRSEHTRIAQLAMEKLVDPLARRRELLAQAARMERDREFVDSARVTRDNYIEVYWKGRPYPYGISFVDPREGGRIRSGSPQVMAARNL